MDLSIIIVARNAMETIERCIESCISQTATLSITWELIVVDGNSSDATVQIVTQFSSLRSIPIVILKNPKQTLATGWNMGLKEARGNYVIRPDAHGELGPNYIKKAISILDKNPNVVAVGGHLETRSEGFWGGIIQEALQSKVGVGNSSFRTGGKRGPMDTVVYGLYRRDIFERVGFFNETLTRNQDNDMHDRIRKSGFLLFYEPDMSAIYHARSGVFKLSRQMFQNGYYMKDLTLKQLSLRHFAPGVFYMGIVTSVVLGVFFPVFCVIGISVYAIYFLVIVMASIQIMIKRKECKQLLNILIIPSMHLSYGAGFLWGQCVKLLRFKF